jgi:CheY-like chemotaxis protein
VSLTPDHRRPLHLLVVEDNPTDRSWLVMMLEGADICPYVLAYAETLATAEAMLHDGTYDCVLLDLRLPDGDGLVSVNRIVTAAPDTPIVVFTGRTEQELGLASIEAGAQDFLVKGQVTGNVILRAARWAAARHEVLRERAAADAGREVATALEHLSAPWARVDRSLEIVATDEAFARRVGRPVRDLVGRSVTDSVRADLLVDVVARLRRAVTGEVDVVELDTTLSLPGHRERPQRVVALRLAIDGEQAGLLLVLLDPDEAANAS